MHTTVTGNVTLDIASEALGIDWMDTDGLPQAIPPAYTRVVGAHLLDLLTATDLQRADGIRRPSTLRCPVQANSIAQSPLAVRAHASTSPSFDAL